MNIEYDSAIIPNNDGSYTINLGGRLDVLLDSNEQDFILEFTVNSQIQGSWNAIVELIGPYNINVQNASYSSYYKLYMKNEYLMEAYTISLTTDVYYKISRIEDVLTIYIELLGTSNIYSQSITCTDNISSIYIGNWDHRNNVTGYIKDIKFSTKITYGYLDKDGLKQVWKNIKNYHETYMNDYYSKEEINTKLSNAGIIPNTTVINMDNYVDLTDTINNSLDGSIIGGYYVAEWEPSQDGWLSLNIDNSSTRLLVDCILSDTVYIRLFDLSSSYICFTVPIQKNKKYRITNRINFFTHVIFMPNT